MPVLWSLSIPPTQQWNKQFILHRIRPESAGCNSARVSCNICVLKGVEVLRPLLYIYMDDISILVPFFTMILHTITKILKFDQIRYPILDAFSVCIVKFIRVDASWSLQISSIHLLGQYINSNLGNVICGSYITTLLSLKQIIGCLICANLKLEIVWYIGGIRSCSTQTSSIYPYGWYINSNLGYVICSKYATVILVHELVQFPRQIRFFASIVWYLSAKRSFSDSILSLYAYGRYINSNLGYVICSTHNNLIMINFGYVAGLYFYTYLCV